MKQPSNRIDEDSIKRAAGENDLALIYKLDLSIHNLLRIEQLELVPKLRCLVLNYNRIGVIEGLRVVPDLRQLHLQNNLLTRLGGLDGNKNLTVLNLANNQIEKIQNVGALTRLDTLNLSNNRLTRLSGIDNLKQMKQLLLQNNCIEVLEYIPAFSKLETINLSHNRIKVVLPNLFQNCVKLLRLDLSHNELKKADFLEPLTNLEQLSLGNNRLEVFFPDVIYQHLDQLDLSYNQLSELPYFPNIFPELMNLNLAGNYITNEVTLLHSIAGHESLVQLDFRQNPMYSESFESAICKLHNFDAVNGRIVGQPGSKYKQKIDDIVREFRQFPQLYMRDDEEDRAIKLSGFYSEELELELTGIKPNRPPSPQRRMVTEKATSDFIASQQAFNQWLKETNEKVEGMRMRSLQIFESHGIRPQTQPAQQLNTSSSSITPMSSRELNSQRELQSIRSEQERQLGKWKEAKAKDKGFNIRDMRKKKSIAEQRQDKPAGSLPKFSRKADKMDLMKTQQLTAFDQKLLNEAMLARTQQRQFRPQSLKK